MVPVQSATFHSRRTHNHFFTQKSSEAAVNYGITIAGFEHAQVNGAYLPQYPDMDLLANMNGVQVEWQPTNQEAGKDVAWKGWLPHPDLDIAKALTQGSLDHEALWPKLQTLGTLTLRGQLDLWQMLQPAIQPGGSLDLRTSDRTNHHHLHSARSVLGFVSAAKSVTSEKNFRRPLASHRETSE